MVLSVYFVATDEHLDVLFPGWVPPGDDPVAIPRRNPFTGESLGGFAYKYAPRSTPRPLGRPSFLDDRWGPAVASVSSAADFELERAIPSGLRACPHFGIGDVELGDFDQLGRALVQTDAASGPIRMGPGHRTTDYALMAKGGYPVVDCLGAAASHALASLTDEQLRAFVDRYLGPHEDAADLDDRDASSWTQQLLLPLRTLARDSLVQRARLCNWWTHA